MRQLEMIRVRASTTLSSEAQSQLIRISKALRGSPGLLAAEILAHSVVHGDFALQLIWEAADPLNGTEVGQAVAEQMRSFGLVDHTTWKVVT